MEPFVLTGPNVRLTVPTHDDVDAITTACRDPEVAAWTTVPSPYRPEHATGFVDGMVGPGWASGHDLVWAIRDDGGFAGMVGLHGRSEGAAEVGFWAAPWARGRGRMTEAVGLVLDAAFDPDGPLALVRVEWRAFVGNWPSRRVAWRHGFRFEGTLRAAGLQRDVRHDSWVAGLLHDDPREPAEPWPAEAPSDNRAVPGAAVVGVRTARGERMEA